MHRKVNTKSGPKFNSGLVLIGLSGTGPVVEIKLLSEHYVNALFAGLEV